MITFTKKVTFKEINKYGNSIITVSIIWHIAAIIVCVHFEIRRKAFCFA